MDKQPSSQPNGRIDNFRSTQKVIQIRSVYKKVGVAPIFFSGSHISIEIPFHFCVVGIINGSYTLVAQFYTKSGVLSYKFIKNNLFQ